jgi:dihydroxy-acid dehydratase
VPHLIEAVKRGVMLAGGLPMASRPSRSTRAFAHPTSMFLRNLMAMDTEEMIRAQPMDAVVLIGGCDKTLPAQLMAAASADLPAVVQPVTGRCWSAIHRARCSAPAPTAGAVGQISRRRDRRTAEIDAVNEPAGASVGTCMVMGTASTMACIVEALGMSCR